MQLLTHTQHLWFLEFTERGCIVIPRTLSKS